MLQEGDPIGKKTLPGRREKEVIYFTFIIFHSYYNTFDILILSSETFNFDIFTANNGLLTRRKFLLLTRRPLIPSFYQRKNQIKNQ